ncbi:MAG: Outer rane porin precursor [Planctomycetota bacterium]|jgi:chemotaxis protein MotB
MRRPLLLVAPLALSAAGCVPQEKYDDLLSAYRAKEQQAIASQREVDRLRNNEESVRRQMQEYANKLAEAEGQLGDQSGEIARLLQDYETFQESVRGLGFNEQISSELNQRLIALANQYPGLLTYDERNGLIQFASDLTFAMGSVELSQDARTAIGALAGILDGSGGVGFEIRVVGHTDNVPLRSGSIYKSNVQLSAQRAISVRDALVKDGVAPDRIMVGGYGEYRPVAENGPRGSAANRRVEIFLLASGDAPTSDEATPETTPAAPKTPARRPVDDEPLK